MSWYLADLVFEVRVEGAERSIVDFALHLIRAKSAVHAYDKAMRLGKDCGRTYLRDNDGAAVQVIFRGLNDLVLMEAKFADRALLLHRSQPGMLEEEIRTVITPREQLRAIQAESAPIDDQPKVTLH